MYSFRPNLIIGFHGCEAKDQQQILNNPKYFKKSQQNYDWLGHGMYFWENDPERARLWAEKKKKAGTLKEPAIIGAVIDLGYCLDMFSNKSIEIIKEAYKLLKSESEALKKPIPENIDHPKEKNGDKVLRELDCAVIQYAHSFFKKEGYKGFDSVRAAFIEGKEIYPNAGFNERTHIQICIINPNCIKGFFLEREINNNFPSV